MLTNDYRENKIYYIIYAIIILYNYAKYIYIYIYIYIYMLNYINIYITMLNI